MICEHICYKLESVTDWARQTDGLILLTYLMCVPTYNPVGLSSIYWFVTIECYHNAGSVRKGN